MFLSRSRRSRGWTLGSRLPGAWRWSWWCRPQAGCSGSFGEGGWSWCPPSSPYRSPSVGLQSGEGSGAQHSQKPHSADVLQRPRPLLFPFLVFWFPSRSQHYTVVQLGLDSIAPSSRSVPFHTLPQSCLSPSAFRPPHVMQGHMCHPLQPLSVFCTEKKGVCMCEGVFPLM